MQISRGTTIEQTALGLGATDKVIWFNTDTNVFEVWNGTMWKLNNDKFEIKLASYNIVSTAEFIEVTTASTQTLPTSVGIAGKKFCIINVSSGNITVNTTASQTIGNAVSGNPTSIVLLPEEVLEIVSNGTNYRII